MSALSVAAAYQLDQVVRHASCGRRGRPWWWQHAWCVHTRVDTLTCGCPSAQVAIPWPDWLRRAATRVGPQPGMLLVTIVFVLGALVAALAPLRETQILLYNTSSNLEVRAARPQCRLLCPRPLGA